MITTNSKNFLRRNRDILNNRRTGIRNVTYEVEWKYDVAGYMDEPMEYLFFGLLITAYNYIIKINIDDNSNINELIHEELSKRLTPNSFVYSLWAEKRHLIDPYDGETKCKLIIVLKAHL